MIDRIYKKKINKANKWLSEHPDYSIRIVGPPEFNKSVAYYRNNPICDGKFVDIYGAERSYLMMFDSCLHHYTSDVLTKSSKVSDDVYAASALAQCAGKRWEDIPNQEREIYLAAVDRVTEVLRKI